MSWFSEQASEAIRRAGGRMTEQRRLVIELLDNTDGQLDVETLYRLANAQDSSISIATIYRTLGVLERAKLVQQRFHSRDHEHRYYERIPAAPEYYFTCRVCRKVIPFRSDLVPEIEQRLAAERGLVVLGACVCLDGLCAVCQAEAKEVDLN